MSIDRRTFMSATAAIAAGAAVRPAFALALPQRVQSSDDPLGVRADFPILQNGRTFLNSAYITPSPKVVTEAGIAFLRAKAERPMSVGELLGKAGAVRAQCARLLNATPDEVGFVFATTEGENIVANNVPMRAGDTSSLMIFTTTGRWWCIANWRSVVASRCELSKTPLVSSHRAISQNMSTVARV